MTLELTIERAAQGGRMIARDPAGGDRGAGAIVLVSGAIPGERVRARVTERRRGVAFAETLEVLEASADRREPPFDPLCGGNAFAHIAYARQIALKREMLADAFRRQARIELAELPPIAASPETGYRMRARLHMAGGRLGFFRERTRDVCDAAGTGQLSEGAAALVAEAQDALAPFGDAIDEVVLAENAAATERRLHVRTLRGEAASALGRWDGALSETLPGGALVTRQAASFFQANRFLFAPLVQSVVNASGDGPLVDLFAGAGVFAVEAASRGREVVAVESDPVSGADLGTNLEPYGAAATAVTGTAEAWLGRAADGAVRGSTVIVDPPRAGLSAGARASLIALRPQRIVYVSCDPVTLARDVKECAAAGYRLLQLEALDLFPNTPHVESIAVLDASGV